MVMPRRISERCFNFKLVGAAMLFFFFPSENWCAFTGTAKCRHVKLNICMCVGTWENIPLSKPVTFFWGNAENITFTASQGQAGLVSSLKATALLCFVGILSDKGSRAGGRGDNVCAVFFLFGEGGGRGDGTNCIPSNSSYLITE